MGKERDVSTGPANLFTRRGIITAAAAAFISMKLGNKAYAMLTSDGDGISSPVKIPLALMYHDINYPASGNVDQEGNWVPPRRFIEQIESIQATGYRIGTMSEALQDPDTTVALTFDDGLHTAYDFVFPFLKKRDIKATFFVPVDAVLKGNRGNPYFMTAQQVKEISDEGNEIGSHSFDHVEITRWETIKGRVGLELKRSKGFLEDLIGKEVPLFAYPNGTHDMYTTEEVMKAGYRAAFISRRTTRLGLKPPLDRFELPRRWITQATNPTDNISAKD